MAINAKMSICIDFCEPKQLAATVAALEPEVNSSVTHRANVDLHVQGCSFILMIHAEDTVALRATANAYLRWIASTVNVVKVAEHM
ncbi:MAG: hypothetical protein LBC03_04105 [Nitrososphaerota archaeon]|nr:hypothetical protein [Nitrososphaerota archaeon]